MSIWKRIGSSSSPAGAAADDTSATPALTLTAQDQDDIRACVLPLVQGGFEEFDDILEVAEDCLNPRDFTTADHAWISDLVESLWRNKLAAEATWSDTRDWDRLDTVFERWTSRASLPCTAHSGDRDHPYRSIATT